MDDNYLIENGFKEFKPGILDNEGVIKCFQKRYDDDIGKKYFITIKKWRGLTHPYTRQTFPPSYESEIQLYKKGSHKALDLTFHTDWELEEVEKYAEMLFNTGKFDYYEVFEK